MSMNNFFARVMQYIANEVIVKGLANNPTFQRLAVRTSQQAKELRKSTGEALRNMAESETANEVRKETQQLQKVAGNFWQQIRREVETSLRGDGRNGPPPRPPTKV